MFKKRDMAWLVAAVTASASVYVLVGKPHMDAGPAITSADDSKPTTKPSGEKQLWSCSMHPWVIQDHPGTCPICHMILTPMHVHSHDTTMSTGMSAGATSQEVSIDPAMVQNMGLRTAEVMHGPLTVSVHTVGSIMVPETALHEINPRVSGWITKLYANQDGLHVRKDEPLYELYSSELKAAAEELVWAVGAGNNKGDSLVDSARQRMRLMGVADREINAIISARKVPDAIIFRSPVSGAVEDKMVVEGSAVQPGTKIMQIDDHSTLWLLAKVFSQDIPAIHIGQHVNVTVDGFGGKSFDATVSFIHPHVDMDTRTDIVRIALDNPSGLLKPGMFASADIVTTPIAHAVIVPREAVIDTGTRQTVFVEKGSGHFEPRAVSIGLGGDDDKVEVLNGLSVGEKVVVSGQFLLDVESRRLEAMQKFMAQSAEAK